MADLKQEYKRNDSFWRRWGALLILGIFFLGSWGGQFVTQLQTAKDEAEQHNQTFSMEEYWPQFWASTFENWQSEWLQLFTQGLLLAGFANYIFRKQDEEHYKTQLMIEDLKKSMENI